MSYLLVLFGVDLQCAVFCFHSYIFCWHALVIVLDCLQRTSIHFLSYDLKYAVICTVAFVVIPAC